MSGTGPISGPPPGAPVTTRASKFKGALGTAGRIASWPVRKPGDLAVWAGRRMYGVEKMLTPLELVKRTLTDSKKKELDRTIRNAIDKDNPDEVSKALVEKIMTQFIGLLSISYRAASACPEAKELTPEELINAALEGLKSGTIKQADSDSHVGKKRDAQDKTEKAEKALLEPGGVELSRSERKALKNEANAINPELNKLKELAGRDDPTAELESIDPSDPTKKKFTPEQKQYFQKLWKVIEDAGIEKGDLRRGAFGDIHNKLKELKILPGSAEEIANEAVMPSVPPGTKHAPPDHYAPRVLYYKEKFNEKIDNDESQAIFIKTKVSDEQTSGFSIEVTKRSRLRIMDKRSPGGLEVVIFHKNQPKRLFLLMTDDDIVKFLEKLNKKKKEADENSDKVYEDEHYADITTAHGTTFRFPAVLADAITDADVEVRYHGTERAARETKERMNKYNTYFTDVDQALAGANSTEYALLAPLAFRTKLASEETNNTTIWTGFKTACKNYLDNRT